MNLGFAVQKDKSASHTLELGIVFTVPKELIDVYESLGNDLEEYTGEKRTYPVAATFVVNKDGTIAWAQVGVDYTLRADPVDFEKVLNTLTLENN